MCERSSLPVSSISVWACSARMRLKFSWPARFSPIHSRAKSPDWISARISRVLARAAGRVLCDRDQPRDAAAFEELAPDQVPGTLRRHERDVDARRRDDLAVVDREAVAEQQQVPGGDAVGDLVLPDIVVQLVR